ncbi:type II toxin-antitoxin system antitoxin SocA domain-containing protein [Bremerella sp. JC770]|uniref:Panacea domain-containing protein n=1 Tax=Bremerella sp. JC770 TaxID=3232137 RepID=UPI0034588A12
MPYSADAIANYFLSRAESEGRTLTQLQVQKLAFYAHGWHLALDAEHRPLIGEQPEVWRHGPVFRSLYSEFADYGSKPISKKAQEFHFIKGEKGTEFQFYEPSIDNEFPPDIDRDFAKALLNRIWELYGHFTPYQLSNMTHQEGEPWRVIRDSLPPGNLPQGLHLPNETTRECFQKKLTPTAS